MITTHQLRATEQFTSFTDADLEMLLGATTARAFAPGECLSVQGRPATSCFIVVSGVVEVVREGDGEGRVLMRLSGGRSRVSSRSSNTSTRRAARRSAR